MTKVTDNYWTDCVAQRHTERHKIEVDPSPGSHLDVSFGGPPTAGLQVERAGQPPKAGPFPFSTRI